MLALGGTPCEQVSSPPVGRKGRAFFEGKMKDKAGDSPDCPHCLEAKAAKEEPTGFEKRSLKEVIESWLYTSENMFGEIVFDAGRELHKRLREVVPPPEWARRK